MPATEMDWDKISAEKMRKQMDGMLAEMGLTEQFNLEGSREREARRFPEGVVCLHHAHPQRGEVMVLSTSERDWNELASEVGWEPVANYRAAIEMELEWLPQETWHAARLEVPNDDGLEEKLETLLGKDGIVHVAWSGGAKLLILARTIPYLMVIMEEDIRQKQGARFLPEFEEVCAIRVRDELQSVLASDGDWLTDKGTHLRLSVGHRGIPMLVARGTDARIRVSISPTFNRFLRLFGLENANNSVDDVMAAFSHRFPDEPQPGRSYIETLLDERGILGSGVSEEDFLEINAYLDMMIHPLQQLQYEANKIKAEAEDANARIEEQLATVLEDLLFLSTPRAVTVLMEEIDGANWASIEDGVLKITDQDAMITVLEESAYDSEYMITASAQQEGEKDRLWWISTNDTDLLILHEGPEMLNKQQWRTIFDLGRDTFAQSDDDWPFPGFRRFQYKPRAWLGLNLGRPLHSTEIQFWASEPDEEFPITISKILAPVRPVVVGVYSYGSYRVWCSTFDWALAFLGDEFHSTLAWGGYDDPKFDLEVPGRAGEQWPKVVPLLKEIASQEDSWITKLDDGYWIRISEDWKEIRELVASIEW